LDGKAALITGASRGLGRAIALALGSAGAKLALVGRDKAKLEETAAEAGSAETSIFVTDVSDEAQVAALAQQAGRVDILVNNAGIASRKHLVDLTLTEWRDVIETNLTSVFLMCRAFVPQMRERKWGRIVNLASIMSHVSLPGRVPYSSSKAGVLGLTRALALELATDGVTVVAISPGPFATDLTTDLRNNPEMNQQFLNSVPMGRWGAAKDVGDLALFLCSEAAGYITGTDILIDGGWTAR
jgi:NAD(P)-dependent dehydrogenase (short-subunit alcohol dehydrogenase family)